jgi:hypothetical protein
MNRKTEVRPTTGHINPFGLRLQPELKAKLEAAAQRNGRSLNTEIALRLELTVKAEETTSDEIDRQIGVELDFLRSELTRLNQEVASLKQKVSLGS